MKWKYKCELRKISKEDKVTFAEGEVDCQCTNPKDPEYSVRGRELPLDRMTLNSYNKLSEWVDGLRTINWISDIKELYKMYEESTKDKLNIHPIKEK